MHQPNSISTGSGQGGQQLSGEPHTPSTSSGPARNGNQSSFVHVWLVTSLVVAGLALIGSLVCWLLHRFKACRNSGDQLEVDPDFETGGPRSADKLGETATGAVINSPSQSVV